MKCNGASATQAVLNFRGFYLSPEVATKQVARPMNCVKLQYFYVTLTGQIFVSRVLTKAFVA